MRNILVIVLSLYCINQLSMVKSSGGNGVHHGPTFGIICGQSCVKQTFQKDVGNKELKCCEINTKINETLTWTQVCCTEICKVGDEHQKHCHGNNCHSCELKNEENDEEH